MDGFTAYKYYMALKQHFTNDRYDVFEAKGRVKCSPEKFQSRNDCYMFEKLGRRFNADKDYIQYIASNFMYKNPDVIYSTDKAETNYTTFKRRRQAITRTFEDDLHTIINSGAKYYDFTGQTVPDVIKLYLSDKISLETMVILDDFDGIVNKISTSTHLKLLIGDDLKRITKAKKFVKYSSYKVMVPYQDFLQEIREK